MHFDKGLCHQSFDCCQFGDDSEGFKHLLKFPSGVLGNIDMTADARLRIATASSSRVMAVAQLELFSSMVNLTQFVAELTTN